MFEFDGTQYTLESMLTSNAHDEEFCAWARAADVGDNFCGCVCLGKEGDIPVRTDDTVPKAC